MLKAEIINLTPRLKLQSKNDVFINSMAKQLGFMDIVLENIIDISNHPETIATDLAGSLARANVIITVGGLGTHLNDTVKHTIIANFSLQTLLHINTFNRIKKHFPQMPDEYLERITCYPKGAKIFECNGISGFSVTSGDRVIICLPDDPADFYDMFSGQVLDYLSEVRYLGYVTKRMLFPKVSLDDAQRSVKRLSDEEICASCYKIPDGTVILVTGREGAVKTTMLALTDELEHYDRKNPVVFPYGSVQRYKIDPEMHVERKKKKGGKKKIIYIGLLSFFIVVGALSASYLGYQYYISYKNEQNNSKLQDIMGDKSSSAPTSSSEESSEEDLPETKVMLEKFNELYEENSDLVGWVKIDGTNVNYPVVQGSNNKYYLNKDFFKKTNKYGIPFADYQSDFEKGNQNIVIYSHNMKDNQMFGDLVNYRRTGYYKEHPIIQFDNLYEEGQYKIISAFITNTDPAHGEVFNYHNRIDFETPADFMEYVHNVRIRSFINTPVDVVETDELLTLSTCTYEFNDARFVVVARKIREGEDPAVDLDKAIANDKPLMPDVWYKLFGGEAPNLPAFVYVPTESSSSEESSSIEESSSSSSSEVSSSEESSSSSSEASSSEESSSSSSESTSSEESSSSSSEASSSEEPSSSSDQASNSEEPSSSSSEVSSSDEQESDSLEVPDLPENYTVYDDEEEYDEDEDYYEEEEESSSSRVDTVNKVDDYEASEDILNEELKINVNGKVQRLSAYDAICGIVENETRGNMHPEAIKAQAVASYTYVKYNNAIGIIPQVAIKSEISAPVKEAVRAVLGKTIRYDGKLINATYHSTSNGKTASAKYVWGSSLPYLVSVDSSYDMESPYYKNTYKISDKDLAKKVLDTYGIDLYTTDINPAQWIEIDRDRMCPGDYVGAVYIGGYDKSKGGTVGRGEAITGRNIREKLLGFNIKSTSFDVTYSKGTFTFTSYGYGHGVGMSQWGAQGMANDGYNHEEILMHYYKGTFVEEY